MTNEESIRHFETQQKRYVREHNGKLCPHYANAIEALRRAQPAEPLTDHISDVTKMVPLTLEQLKQMDGEPVWCADGEGHSCYCLVNAESEDCIDSECGAWCFEFYGMTGDGENGLHNMGWLAYAHTKEI